MLVDAGSGSVPAMARTHAFLAEHGVEAADLAWLAVALFHADHAAALGAPVAAHAEADGVFDTTIAHVPRGPLEVRRLP